MLNGSYYPLLPPFKTLGLLNSDNTLNWHMSVQQILLKEIEESRKWLDRETDESAYKRDLKKRIELINWVLENMKNLDIPICDNIESKMREIIMAINRTHSIIEADKLHKLHSELRIFGLDFISSL